MKLPNTYLSSPISDARVLSLVLGLVMTLSGCSLLLDEASSDAPDAGLVDAMGAGDSAESDATSGPQLVLAQMAIQSTGTKTYNTNDDNTLLLLAAAGGASRPTVAQDLAIAALVEHESGLPQNARWVAIYKLEQGELSVEVPSSAVASLGFVRIVNALEPAFLDFAQGGSANSCNAAKTINFVAPGLVLGLATIPNGAQNVNLQEAGETVSLFTEAEPNISAIGLWDPSADVLEYSCDIGTPAHVGLRILDQ